MNLSKYIFLAVLVFGLANCTPKTGTKIADQKVTTPATAKESTTTATSTSVKPAIIKEGFRTTAPKAGPAPKIELGTSQQFELPNGLKVIVVENHKLPIIDYQIVIDEEAWLENDKAGISDIMGDLLTRGTTTKSKAEIDESIDFLGASMYSSGTVMGGRSLTKHSDAFLSSFSDVLKNPAFSKSEFDKVVKQYESSLASSKEDANEISSNIRSIVNFGKNHPYGEIMTENSLANINVEDCKAFYDKYWNPKDAYLVLIGDLDLAKAKSIANNYFGTWEAKPISKPVAFETPQAPKARTVDFVNKTGAVQSVISLTYPVDLKVGAEDRSAVRVLSTILGGYFNSRVNQNLREDNAYTYGARGSVSGDPIIGSFYAGASVRNEVTDSAVIELLYEINKLRTEKVGEEELQLVKNVISGNFGRSLESARTLARFALNKSRYDLPNDYYDNYLARIAAVNADDVMAAAKKYLKPDNAHLVVVGNRNEVAEKLIPFAASGTINYYDAFGNLLKVNTETIAMTAEAILEKYKKAIGGEEKLNTVKSMKTIMTTEIQGMKMQSTSTVRNDEKLRIDMDMAGSVVNTQIYNDGKASMASMGQKMPMDEKQSASFKFNSVPFPALHYGDWQVTGMVNGIEKVEEKDAYEVSWSEPGGNTWTDYFDKETGLKVKTVISFDTGGGNMVSQTIVFKDYTEVEGIKIPYTSIISGGMMPMAMTMNTTSVEINPTIDETIFKIEE